MPRILTLAGFACGGNGAKGGAARRAAVRNPCPGRCVGRRCRGLDAIRYDLDAKRGPVDGWTGALKAEFVRFGDASQFDDEACRATRRRRSCRRGRIAAAVEAGAPRLCVWRRARRAGDIWRRSEDRRGFSRGWERGRDWFAFPDLAARTYERGGGRRRLEAGCGSVTAGRWKTLTQVWHERGSGEARSDKVETAIVYDLGDLDFSLAWREGISGRFEEPGIVFAISREF